MPFCRFMLHGRDVYRSSGERGFFTTHHAFARTQDEAAQKVLARLTREFTMGIYAGIWRGGPPALTIEKAWPISVFELFPAPNRGSTFYGED